MENTTLASQKKKTTAKRKTKTSYYGLQLREKQKLKRFYGVAEKKFRKYYKIASHSSENTGDVLRQCLERRLDNVVYRMGLAVSRAQARQIVVHRLFTVNGVTCNIPSYSVSKNDIISLRDNKRDYSIIKANLERDYIVPQWISKKDDYTGVIVDFPLREDMQDIDVKEQLIIELYSK